MKKMILPAGLLFMLFLFSFNRPVKKIQFRIQAEITGLKDDNIFLYIRNTDAKTSKIKIDTLSTVSKNGRFTLTGETDEVTNASILIGVKGRKNFSLFLENGAIQVKGHIDSIEKVRLSGTPENEIYTAANLHQHIFYDSINLLYAELEKLTDKKSSRASAIHSSVNSLRDSVQQYWIDFTSSHPDALTSGIYLYVLQSRVPVETLERLYNGVSPRIKNGPYGPGVKAKIMAEKRTAIGNPAPDFAVVDLTGKNISLANYKGKYVLLDFWASWCVPCREENPALKAAYKKFVSKGFTIVSVSLDSDAAKWKAAIIKDSLPWTHINEINGFDNSIAKIYGVQPIPDNFLISPDGKILARQLRGDDVDKTLSQYIK